jgi:hypothetical protein
MSSIVHVFDRVRATGYNCLVVRGQCPLRVVFAVSSATAFYRASGFDPLAHSASWSAIGA